MYSKFVIRLMSATGILLGWTEIMGHARGDGCIWAEKDMEIVADCAGVPNVLSVHWADVNIEIRKAIDIGPVSIGTRVPIPAGMIIRVGEMPGYLPPVTVRGNCGIGVPVGSLSAVSPA